MKSFQWKPVFLYLGLSMMIALVACASLWDALHPAQVQVSRSFAEAPPLPLIMVGSLWLSSLVGTYICLCRGHFLTANCPAAWLAKGLLLLLCGCWLSLTILCASYGIWDACLLLAAGDVGWVMLLVSGNVLWEGGKP